jgi:hypothetical protein
VGQYRIKSSEHTMKLRIIHPAPVTERIDIIKMTMLSVSIWPPLMLRLSRCSISFQVSVPRKCVRAETIMELLPVVFHQGIPHIFYINLHQEKSKACSCDSDSNSWVDDLPQALTPCGMLPAIFSIAGAICRLSRRHTCLLTSCGS